MKKPKLHPHFIEDSVLVIVVILLIAGFALVILNEREPATIAPEPSVHDQLIDPDSPAPLPVESMPSDGHSGGDSQEYNEQTHGYPGEGAQQ